MSYKCLFAFGSFESGSRKIHALHPVDIFLGNHRQPARVGPEESGRRHACWAFDAALPDRQACRALFHVVTKDGAYADPFLNSFCRKYCPIVQMRMPRLREMTSPRTLNPKGRTGMWPRPGCGHRALFLLNSSMCCFSAWALVYMGCWSDTRDDIPARHRKVSVN